MSKNTWSKDRPQKPERDPMLDDLLLIQAMKAGPRHQTLANESYAQLKHFKETGELK